MDAEQYSSPVLRAPKQPKRRKMGMCRRQIGLDACRAEESVLLVVTRETRHRPSRGGLGKMVHDAEEVTLETGNKLRSWNTMESASQALRCGVVIGCLPSVPEDADVGLVRSHCVGVLALGVRAMRCERVYDLCAASRPNMLPHHIVAEVDEGGRSGSAG